MIDAINSEPMLIPGLIAFAFICGMFAFCVLASVAIAMQEKWPKKVKVRRFK